MPAEVSNPSRLRLQLPGIHRATVGAAAKHADDSASEPDMTDHLAGAVRGVVDRILAVPGRLTLESVSDVCAVTLQEVACSNAYMQEFIAPVLEGGPLSSVTFRMPIAQSGRPDALVILEAAAESQITDSDLAGHFHLALESARVNPRVPPEGIISFEENYKFRSLYIELTVGSRILQSIIVHDTL